MATLVPVDFCTRLLSVGNGCTSKWARAPHELARLEVEPFDLRCEPTYLAIPIQNLGRTRSARNLSTTIELPAGSSARRRRSRQPFGYAMPRCRGAATAIAVHTPQRYTGMITQWWPVKNFLHTGPVPEPQLEKPIARYAVFFGIDLSYPRDFVLNYLKKLWLNNFLFFKAVSDIRCCTYDLSVHSLGLSLFDKFYTAFRIKETCIRPF